jgi:hypothetical protein
MLSPIVSKVLQTLSDVPTLAIAHERLALARELLEQMEGENERLRAEVERMQRELETRPPVEFTEHRGVLWKRLPGGGFAPDPYCPVHRTVLSSRAGHTICSITKCGFEAPFYIREVPEIHQAIPADA